MELTWIIIVFVAGLLAMLAELFLPGAVLGIIGFLTVCSAIVYAFWQGYTVTGGVLVAVTLAMLPVFFVIWRSVLGRFLAIKQTIKGTSSGRADADRELLGTEGDAMSQLRPSGVALIEGKRRSVVTRGEIVEKGARIKVIDASGGQIIVKKAQDQLASH